MFESKQLPSSGMEKKATQDRVYTNTSELVRVVLELDDYYFQAICSYGFIETAEGFIQMARKFYPIISEQDIFQAARNVWAMNMIL